MRATGYLEMIINCLIAGETVSNELMYNAVKEHKIVIHHDNTERFQKIKEQLQCQK